MQAYSFIITHLPATDTKAARIKMSFDTDEYFTVEACSMTEDVIRSAATAWLYKYVSFKPICYHRQAALHRKATVSIVTVYSEHIDGFCELPDLSDCI